MCKVFLPPQQTAKRCVWGNFGNWQVLKSMGTLDYMGPTYNSLKSVPSLTQCPTMTIEVSYWIFPQLPFSEYLLCPISLVPIYSCSVLLCVSQHLQQLKKVSSNFLSWLKDKKTSGDNTSYNTPQEVTPNTTSRCLSGRRTTHSSRQTGIFCAPFTKFQFQLFVAQRFFY